MTKNDSLDDREAKQRVIEWSKEDAMHPHLFQSFYEDLDCPQDNEEAEIMRNCHIHAVNDIDLQITTADLEIEMLNTEMQGKQLIGELNDDAMHKQLWEVQNKKRKLMFAKRRHISSANAYWYFMQ